MDSTRVNIFTKIKCWFGGHRWTCAAQKGLPPTPEQLSKGWQGVKEYATMYCDRCGHVSELNKRLKP